MKGSALPTTRGSTSSTTTATAILTPIPPSCQGVGEGKPIRSKGVVCRQTSRKGRKGFTAIPPSRTVAASVRLTLKNQYAAPQLPDPLPSLTITYPPTKTPSYSNVFLDEKFSPTTLLTELCLGRNLLTQIKQAAYDPHICTIKFHPPECQESSSSSSSSSSALAAAAATTVVNPRMIPELRLYPKLHHSPRRGESYTSPRDVVTLNGERLALASSGLKSPSHTLKHGDVIELHPNDAAVGDCGIKYKVHILVNPSDELDHPSPLQPQPMPSASQAVGAAAVAAKPIPKQEDVTHYASTVTVPPAPAVLAPGPPPVPVPPPVQPSINLELNNNCATKETARKNLIDEVTCAICMEIVVETHMGHPCGHLFCGPCVNTMAVKGKKRKRPTKSIPSCPICRKSITLTHVRSYDDVVWNMILMGSVFGYSDVTNDMTSGHDDGMDIATMLQREEDLRQFLKRSGRDISQLSREQLDCIFGRPVEAVPKKVKSKSSSTNNHRHRLKAKVEETDDSPIMDPLDNLLQTFMNPAFLENQPIIDLSANSPPSPITSGTMDDPICL